MRRRAIVTTILMLMLCAAAEARIQRKAKARPLPAPNTAREPLQGYKRGDVTIYPIGGQWEPYLEVETGDTTALLTLVRGEDRWITILEKQK